MIDTHTHLYMTDSFPDGGISAVCRAVEAGVDTMVLPGVDIESVDPILRLHEATPGHTAVALGLHPTEVEADWRSELNEILNQGADVDLVAIGETGVDLHWDAGNLIHQMDAFGEQIQYALEHQLPVIVHSRDAVDQTVEIVSKFEALPPMVFHSFTSGVEDMRRLLEAAPDAFVGINGVVTFKNAAPLAEAVKELDMDKLVVETDAPFLAPVPHRGKTNESAYIPHIVAKIAELKGRTPEEIAAITTANALRLYPSLKKICKG